MSEGKNAKLDAFEALRAIDEEIEEQVLGKNTKHAELIAEARSFFCWPEESSTDELGRNLADALEAADARNAELEADVEELANAGVATDYALTDAKAERDAALAVIEQVRKAACDGLADCDDDYEMSSIGVLEMLEATPADALAEHDRVIAEKAWDEDHLQGYDSGLYSGDDTEPETVETRSLETNPYRANPEPNTTTKGANQ